MILQIFFLVVALIIYLIFQKNIITLAVLKSIILYPKLNELKTVKKLHIIYSFSILFSFILTPVFSNIILRTFFSKNDFIFHKLDNKSFKGSKLVLSELTLDFIIAIFTYGILLIIVLLKSTIVPYILFIIVLISILLSSTLSKFFIIKNNLYNIPTFINQNKFASFTFISFLKILRIISRDVIFIFLIINFKQNHIDLFDLKIDLIFKQALMFNSSNYIQFLPANLLIPELLCNQFNCLLIDYIWLRTCLLFSTTLLTIYFFRKKFISF